MGDDDANNKSGAGLNNKKNEEIDDDKNKNGEKFCVELHQINLLTTH
jgi:hypothetical protein